ncbi:MAG: hypothetical protein ACRCZJ_06725 [Erysipelotrichaceae bacterium]
MKRWLGLGILPFFTLWFASQGDWIFHSLSEVGNMQGMRFVFLVWGLAHGLYYGWMLHAIQSKLKYRVPQQLRLLLIAFLLLVVSLLLPYELEQFPFLSELHILTSAIAPVLMMSMVFWFAFEEKQRFIICNQLYHAYVILCVVCAGLWLFFGKVTSLMEVVTAIGLCVWFVVYDEKCNELHNL